LHRLLGDADLRAKLGNSARRLAVERFSLDAMGAALKRLYENVLAA
jgi:glycosyltransferase involved in cell wall biosynthesis